MKKIYTFSFLMTMIFILTSSVAHAWNTNTSVNTLVATVPVADMQSVSTTDLKTWVAFYHQNGGNYDMRAQLLDANGNKLLGADGILVSNQPSGTATFVFNVCVDASNNLIIAFQDMRTGSDMSAVIYKISQTGTQLWGTNGIVLGTGLAPYPALLSNGEVVVGWNDSNGNTLNIQKITASGTPAWGTPIVVLVGSSTTTRGQLIGNTNGKFTVVYQKRGFGISTTLYSQMYDNAGVALYSALQISNLTTSGARYYSITAEADTTYFGYYASSGSRFNSYLQKITPAGTMPYGINGSSFNTNIGSSDSYQMTTSIAHSTGSNFVWSVCTFSDFNQITYGVYVQKFNKNTGARQFTDNAKIVYAISSNTDQLAGPLVLINDTPMFSTYDVNYKIYATRLDANGNFTWPGNRVEISSTTATMANGKMRYGFAADGPNRCVATWTENRTGDYQAFAQGISIGGLVGLVVATQGNVPAVITTSAGTLQMTATVSPAAASQLVTWSIVNGTGLASISATGLVTAIASGTVYAKAVAVQDISVKDSMLITISNQGPLAPTVTTLAASNIVTTTATLNGNVNANGASTSVSFQWGLTTSYGNTATATPATVTGNSITGVTAAISGLTIGLTYHFRCVGTNSMGTTNGNDMTFVAGCTPLTTAGTITGPVNVCQNSTGNVYSVPAVPNATGYVWVVPTGATITAGTNTNSITVTFGTVSGDVTVYATNTCSNSSTSTQPVAVNPPPVPTISGSSSACVTTTVLYTTEPGMTNYTWTVSAGGSIASGTGTNSVQVTWNTTGAQSVTVNYTGTSGCAGLNPTTFPVTVTNLPGAAGVITGTSEVCAGLSGVAYSCGVITDAVAYVWTLPSGATIASGNNTNSITVDFSSSAVSGNITVVGNNTCGNGPVSPDFTLTVNPPAPGPVISELNGFYLISSEPVGNQWYHHPQLSDPGIMIPGETNDTLWVTFNAEYYYSIVTLGGCPSEKSNEIYMIIEGTDEIANANLSIYPVPNDGRFTISFINGSDQVNISIYNVTGEKIFNSEVAQGTFKKEIDIRNSPAGVYMVKFTTKESTIARKIIVNK